ncbi:MAG: response regulator [Vallitalea sp.]|jgi:two-component system response regulator YesN|nr:response regulator [Vallitalea sp.]
MYKVMIIDDEPMIIQSIRSGIDWEKLMLEVVYTATDSRDALNYAKENPIDIVISDISMPPFNGLTMCSEITKIDPSIQFIIISGYADFAYAKKAIQIGVAGYCLKPIDYAEMRSVLNIAINKIEPSNDFIEYDFMEYVYENNIDEIKKFLIQNKIRDKFYIIMVIGKENLSKYITVHHLVFNLGINKYLYIVNDDISYSLLDKEIKNSPLIDGIAITSDKISYDNLLKNIDDIMVKSYGFFFCKEKIFKEEYTIQDDYYLEIYNNIEKPSILKNSLKNLCNSNCPQMNIKQAMKLHNIILNKYKKQIYEEDDDLNIYSFDELIRHYKRFDYMIDSLIEVIESTYDNKEIVFESYNKNFLKVIKYINTNYTKNMSIKDIAEELFLNPNYISQLFKKETGTTYVKYLTKLRIEKAKELLKDTDMSINDVCINSGFNDYFYFIKKFKKYTDMAPSYYRKNNI